MDDEEIKKLNELEEKKKFLKESITKIEIIIDDLEFWEIDTDDLYEGLMILKTELNDTETELDEIENSESYEEQLKYQQKEYRKMQGF